MSRYYDPETGRFISPDTIEYLDPETLGGLNLYAYCGNNPVMYVDPSGHSWESFWNDVGNWFSEFWPHIVSGLEIIGGIVLMFVPGAQGYSAMLLGMGIGSLVNGYINQSVGGSFLAGWSGGQISALLAAIPFVGVPIGAFAGSVVSDTIDYGWQNIDFEKALWSAAFAYVLEIIPMTVQLYGGSINSFSTLNAILDYRNILVTIINGFFNSYFNNRKLRTN